MCIHHSNLYGSSVVAGLGQTWFLHVATLLNNHKIKTVPTSSSLNSNKIVKFSIKLNLVKSRQNTSTRSSTCIVLDKCDTLYYFGFLPIATFLNNNKIKIVLGSLNATK
jgi:hypothetical protein